MDWLTFAAAMADALAWPAAAVAILLILRKPLIELLPQVRRLRFKELEAEFGRGVAKIEEQVAAEFPGQAETGAAENREASLVTLATIAPAAAVLAAWKQVEGGARRLIASHGTDVDYRTPTPYRLIEGTLNRSGLLEQKKVKIFRELRQLRNKVAHADRFEPTVEQAIEYVRASVALACFLDRQAAEATQ